MKYWQCSKCKTLLEMADSKFNTKIVTQTDGGTIDIISIKPENLEEILCHGRRMRELNQDKYDHEVIQREHIENGGPAPQDTELMKKVT